MLRAGSGFRVNGIPVRIMVRSKIHSLEREGGVFRDRKHRVVSNRRIVSLHNNRNDSCRLESACILHGVTERIGTVIVRVRRVGQSVATLTHQPVRGIGVSDDLQRSVEGEVVCCRIDRRRNVLNCRNGVPNRYRRMGQRRIEQNVNVHACACRVACAVRGLHQDNVHVVEEAVCRSIGEQIPLLRHRSVERAFGDCKGHG